MKTTFTLIAALMLGSAAFAHEVKQGDLEIYHPNIPQPPVTAKSAAGYMVVVNEGAQSLSLIHI